MPSLLSGNLAAITATKIFGSLNTAAGILETNQAAHMADEALVTEVFNFITSLFGYTKMKEGKATWQKYNEFVVLPPEEGPPAAGADMALADAYVLLWDANELANATELANIAHRIWDQTTFQSAIGRARRNAREVTEFRETYIYCGAE